MFRRQEHSLCCLHISPICEENGITDLSRSAVQTISLPQSSASSTEIRPLQTMGFPGPSGCRHSKWLRCCDGFHTCLYCFAEMGCRRGNSICLCSKERRPLPSRLGAVFGTFTHFRAQFLKWGMNTTPQNAQYRRLPFLTLLYFVFLPRNVILLLCSREEF